MQLVTQEITSYRAADAPDLDSNLCEWWRSHELTYSCVTKLAKTYLAVPATSVPSERVFSKAGEIISAKRSALISENVEKLIFLSINMKVDDDE